MLVVWKGSDIEQEQERVRRLRLRNEPWEALRVRLEIENK